MRKEFVDAMKRIIVNDPQTVFITGDIGFNVLEDLRKIGKDRFINGGVAEQTIVGVAAGLAYKGFQTFTYGIAPFAVYRCLEQIKIDVCIHNLPVYIVGNGGGYGYGIMGATHHAIEDIACLSAMPSMTCWVPAFSEDVDFCMTRIIKEKKPAYLRLGSAQNYPNPVSISTINAIRLTTSPRLTIIVLGPVVQNVLQAITDNNNVDVFTILTIPLLELNDAMIKSIDASRKILVVEEHVERGGLGEHLLALLAKKGINNFNYLGLHAEGYPGKIYGNQLFHQTQSGLDAGNIKKQIDRLINDPIAD